jgi:hypothetical protein
MSLSRAVDFEVTTKVRRFNTELEFEADPDGRTAESVNTKIAEMRMELADAQASVRTLLAMARLSLEELGK